MKPLIEADIHPTIEDAVKAVDAWESPIHSIRHVVELDNGQQEGFVVMGHINCDTCNYCLENGNQLPTRNFATGPHKQLEEVYS